MYVPIQPLWLWNYIAAEHEQRLSQPTVVWQGSQVQWFPYATACLARCHVLTWFEEGDGSHRTSDIQCGRLASPAPDGAMLCGYHLGELWYCPQCEGLKATNAERFCSSACKQAWDTAFPGEEEYWERLS